MDYNQPSQHQPSHFEYRVELDKRDSAKIKLKAFEYMDQLEGWCAYEQASILIDLILKNKPETVVEIGVFGGKSLIPMAYALKVNEKGKIYGIDPWEGSASIQGVMDESNKYFWTIVNYQEIMSGLIYKVKQFGLENQIDLIRKTSEATPPIYDIDLLHIDGNHSEEASYLDVTKWVPLVKSGGIIVFDDMTWYENNTYTTAKAVAWLNANCIKFGEFLDVCQWGIWIKP